MKILKMTAIRTLGNRMHSNASMLPFKFVLSFLLFGFIILRSKNTFVQNETFDNRQRKIRIINDKREWKKFFKC